MKKPRISVIICAYNRAELLNLALQSLSGQTAHKEDFEVIVVDNCSTDNTKEVVKKWLIDKDLPVYYHYELQPGLSFARNTGIQLSNYNYLLYLDDDIIADQDLISSYMDFLQTSETEMIACLGGRVLIEWENGQKPEWLPEEFLNLYGHFDLGQSIVESHHAVGCNMLWKKDILQKFGAFSTDLGRIGGKKLASEETVLMKEVVGSNYKIFYIPAATVNHWAPQERQTREYIYEICYWLGVSKAISEMAYTAEWKKKFECVFLEFYRLFNSVRALIRSRDFKFRPLSATEVVFITGRKKFFDGYVKKVIFA